MPPPETPSSPYPQWVERARITTGLDHLGLQAISISLYGTLLPGITNLTQRARYFSMYPWFLSAYIKRVGVINKREKWRDFLRRAEFLYALVSSSQDEKAVPGSNTAKRVLLEKAKTIQLADYADHSVKGENRYWKVSYGAYGQYYLGALQALNIIQFDKNDEVEHLGENGLRAAEAVEDVVSSTARTIFQNAVTSGEVKWNDLDDLSAEFPPSKLSGKSVEGIVLRDIFLRTKSNNGEKRINSLRLLLELVQQCPSGMSLDVNLVRQVIFNGSFGDGTPFMPSKGLSEICEDWKSYNIGEHLHYALENIFWALLCKLRQHGPVTIETFVERMAHEATSVLASSGLLTKNQVEQLSWGDCLDVIDKKVLPEGGLWGTHQNSCFRIVAELNESRKSNRINDCVAKAFTLYSHMLVVYSRCGHMKGLFAPEQHLGYSFPEENTWILLNDKKQFYDMSPVEALKSFFLNRILNRHLKVAFRKLRNQSESTFKFMLRDKNIIWLEDIDPTFTQPRIRSAMNILEDLDLVELVPAHITELGKNHIE